MNFCLQIKIKHNSTFSTFYNTTGNIGNKIHTLFIAFYWIRQQIEYFSIPGDRISNVNVSLCRVFGLIKFNGIPSPLGRQNVQFSSGSNPGVSGQKPHQKWIKSAPSSMIDEAFHRKSSLSLIKSFNKWTAFGGNLKMYKWDRAEEGSEHIFSGR